VRIKNQYLMSILSLVMRLGARNVSSLLVAEAWRDGGRTCDDVFFMHFDVLFSYHFLEKVKSQDLVVGFEALMQTERAKDFQISITDDGREFLHRYG